MSNFEKELLDIIDERETVLFEIEKVLFIRRYNLSEKHKEIFAVQSITMMYSIWEGFVQRACQLYISELNQQKIEFHRFSDEIVIFHMESKYKQLEDRFKKLKEYEDKDWNKKTSLYSMLYQFFTNNHQVLQPVVNTESNVNFKVLNRILKSLSLEPFPEYWETQERYESWEVKEYRIDLQLALATFLKYRNSVAHGGDISSEEKVTDKVYAKYKKLVVDLMYGIHSRMMTGLDKKSYLK